MEQRCLLHNVWSLLFDHLLFDETYEVRVSPINTAKCLYLSCQILFLRLSFAILLLYYLSSNGKQAIISEDEEKLARTGAGLYSLMYLIILLSFFFTCLNKPEVCLDR